MKINILIITVLISNIAFANVAPIEDFNNKLLKENNFIQYKEIRNDIFKEMSSKGLEKDFINKQINKYILQNDVILSLMIDNILHEFDYIKYEDVLSFYSKSILNNKEIKLNEYSTLISLLQYKSIFNIDQEIKNKLFKIADLNNELLTLNEEIIF